MRRPGPCARTLADLLQALWAPAGSLVVLDRGDAPAACLAGLREPGSRDPGVSRERRQHCAAAAAGTGRMQAYRTVPLPQAVSPDPAEVRLDCYSAERGLGERWSTRFEAALAQFHAGLARPRTRKRLA